MYIAMRNTPREIEGPFPSTAQGLSDCKTAAERMASNDPSQKVYVLQTLEYCEAGPRPITWTPTP